MTSILLVLEVVNSRNGNSPKDWISFGPMNHPFVARANEANENTTQYACALDFFNLQTKIYRSVFTSIIGY